ncbi:hypothetical protein Tco_1091198 [Tanacetum coccineum]|uniref:Uncharacterized protein n=1 Tax=Tanacetum coccineum TaxID=301880 RepID=A0ABQ5I6J0_9ASTR
MERDCQHGLYKAGMGSSRVLSDFAEKYGSKNRVLAGFGIGGKSGKEKVKDTMADMNIPANDAPTEQAPDITPPNRTDDQIFPSSKWVPIGKSNCVFDVQKS